MVHINKVLFLFALLAHYTLQENGDEKCRDNAKCMSINLCVSVQQFLQLHRDSNYIRNIECGFVQSIPLVCCYDTHPYDNIAFPTSTESQNDSIPTTPPPRRPLNQPKDTVQSRPTQPITSRYPSIRQNDTTNIKYPDVSHVTAQGEDVIRVTGAVLPDKDICGIQEQLILDKILGGELTDISEFPWTARLKYRNLDTNVETYACGGSLISDQYIVTAAHCVNLGNRNIELIQVRLGEWNDKTEQDCNMDSSKCSNPPDDVGIDKIYTHPDFNKSVYIMKADIAVIRLKRPVVFTEFVKPICLPITDDISVLDRKHNAYWAAGWGRTEYGSYSAVKRKIEINSVPINTCKATYPNITSELSSDIICAGGRVGHDTCSGDSGGPLMLPIKDKYKTNWYLFGVISYGYSVCGTEGKPGIYTRATAYTKWIQDVLRG